MDDKVFYALVTAVVVIGGIGIGVAYSYTSSHPVTVQATGPYYLTMVVTPNNPYQINATFEHRQPSYFIVGPNNTLESAATINLPAHREIILTIIDYDSGPTPNIGPTGTSNNTTYTKVIGTVGNVEYVYNSTIPVSSYSKNTTQIQKPEAISQIPWYGNSSWGYNITHTFTILSGSTILVNIPSWGGSTTVAYLYLNNTGTYNWQCFVPCGYGNDGWGAAMVTAGWMTGTVNVQ
ncbi:hypothetical protein [Thermoplasma volcanium]|nr:hypothetical protein [Thermoplasma volcanium]